ncbi:MAG: AmmeMemoRadiSam system protein B, partial [Bdellovibrionales bacterium]|nr:AmmeMemoRadiSam system protein B [Bdellovibrionales bacterium]
MSAPLFPQLRWPIDLQIEKFDKDEILVVRCPLGIAPQPLLLVPAVSPILACFDGSMSLDEIHHKFTPHGVGRPLLEELVRILDEGLFLHGPRFHAAEQAIKLGFSQRTSRPAALAGLSYALDPVKLSEQLSAYLDSASVKGSQKNLICLVAPHIDYQRGWRTYGATYANLLSDNIDLYVVVGTAHQYSRRMFHLTLKDFETPLGSLQCDREFVGSLARLYGEERSFADEILHRQEHSLELQMPFIKFLRGEAMIAPILVGSFHQMLNSGKSPEEFEEYETFASALSETISDQIRAGRSVAFVAGVDMAHVGRAFGDSGSLTAEFMQQVKDRDHEYLRAVSNQSKRSLWEHIESDVDARRICGFPTMYTIIDVLD